MADGADKLDKLSRLRSLKSGLRARGGAAEPEDALSLDAIIDGEKAPAAPVADPAPPPAPEKPAPAPESPSPAAAQEDDAESLSAYFEALGIVPDAARKTGAMGSPPDAYVPPSGAYTNPVDTPRAAKGRDVDIRDRWADPVREDESYLSSFAGDPPVHKEEEATPEVAEEKTGPAFDAPVSGPEQQATGEPGDPPEAVPLAAPVPPEDPAEEPPVAADAMPEIALPDDVRDDLPDSDPGDAAVPDFGQTVDIEAFERELAEAEGPRDAPPVEAADPDPAGADPDPDPGDVLHVTFDPGRAATLAQVSKQMGCSVDDVVVTAIDWYLDALLGDEEGQAEAENAGS